MNYLSRTMGVNTFIFYGLCSGAYLGFEVARIDKRVRGFIQIDGYLYKTTGYYLRYYARRLFNPRAWLSFIKNLFIQRTRKHSLQKGQQAEVQEWPDIPSREYTRDGYAILVERSIEMLFFITSCPRNKYNYENQFFDIFPGFDFKGLMQTEYMPDASHILREQSSQEKVMQTTCDWLKSKIICS